MDAAPRVLETIETRDSVVELTLDEYNVIKGQYAKYFEVSRAYSSQVTITPKSYIGVFHVASGLTVVVKPKIDFADFIGMLRYVDSRRVVVWKKLVSGIQKSDNFIDFFISRFVEDVFTLLLQKRRQAFEKKEVLTSRIRGKILVSRSVSRVQRCEPELYCQVHDFSLNNLHNQVIRCAMEYIRPVVPDKAVSTYHTILHVLKDVDAIHKREIEFDRIPYDRFTDAYKHVHEFCRLILNDFSLEFVAGRETFYAFALNSWNVYEVFLREIFKRFQKVYDIDAYKISEINEDIDWTNKKQNRPDIIASKDGDVRFLMDAKYKKGERDSDYHQMVTYLVQRAPAPQLRYGALIYPRDDPTQEDGEYRDYKVVKIYYVDLKRVEEGYLRQFVEKILDDFQKDGP